MRPAERAVLIGCVLAIAAVLRIAFAWCAQVQSPLAADAGQYAQYAANLCEHGTFSLAKQVPPPPDSFRSPGYPLFLAACRACAGAAGWQGLAIALQVALGVLTVLALYRTVRACAGFGAGLLAASLVALSPHLVVSSSFLLTECLTCFLVTVGFWLVAGARSRVRLAAGAAAFGAAVLCNEALLPVPLLVGCVWWRKERGRAACFVGLALLPFVAWTLRNQVTELHLRGSERVVASISHGSYPGMVFGGDPRSFGFPYRADPEQPRFGSSWPELRRVLGERVAAALWRHAAWFLLEKPVWLWSFDLVQGDGVMVYAVSGSPYERHAVMGATYTLMRWLHAPLMVLAAVGGLLSMLRARREAGWLPAAMAAAAVAVTLAYLPVIPDPRYLQPVRPLVLGIGAITCMALMARRRRGRRDSIAAP